jgi:drug/metabolite transporter (DMT)-like permease
VLTVALALSAAAVYGLSDFLGGFVSRRASVWAVALASQIGALVVIGIAAWLLVDGRPTIGDLSWGALAGLGTGSGTAFLYRGLAEGRMGVVAPISAVGTALVPVAVGVVTGDRPSAVVWIGIACAIPAIWLVSASERSPAAAERMGAGVVDGILAGVGFGLMFSALGQVPERAGLAPLLAAEVSSVLAVVALAVAMGHAWRPRQRAAWWGLVVGALSAFAAVMFLYATQAGMLTVSAVLSSLYPVFTVLLAATLLRERIGGLQAVGLALAGAAVVMVALG